MCISLGFYSIKGVFLILGFLRAMFAGVFCRHFSRFSRPEDFGGIWIFSGHGGVSPGCDL